MNITKIVIPTTNYDTSRKPIKRIVIHWIVGNLAAADATFKKLGGQTSAHYGVENNNVHQYVDEAHTAYHAGVYAINQESIGIEHSAAPDRPASEATYQSSGKLIAEICKRYNIPLDRQHIQKHSEFKATQCCGTVDVDKLITIAKQGSLEGLAIQVGYNPSFEGQDVTVGGVHYKAIKVDGKLIWKTESPEDWKKRYEEEVAVHKATKLALEASLTKIANAKIALN